MKKTLPIAGMLLALAGLVTAMPSSALGPGRQSGGASVGWKPVGRMLNATPSLDQSGTHIRRVPDKADVYGATNVFGLPETLATVALPQSRKAPDNAGASGDNVRKAQALLIFSDSRKACNSIIELPIAAGKVESFATVKQNVPNMPYKDYGEKVVAAVALDNAFVTSTFCQMMYSQTNGVYNWTDWSHKYNYDYRAADLEVTTLAYNPDDGMVYGVFQGIDPETQKDSWFFGRWVDATSYTRPEVISWIGDNGWYGMAISPAGVVYAIDSSCNLLKVDKTTGQTEKIGSTGLSNKYKTSGCYDSESGRILFATSLDRGSALYTIDPTTGRATMLYAMPDGEQMVGMFIPSAAADPKAPAAASDIKVEFPLGSNTGNIIFTVPATYYDGTAATGTVAYEVMLDGNSVGKGTAAYGTTVSVPVTVEKAAKGNITVKLSNSAGAGPLARASLFCGTPVPRNPYINKNLAYDEAAKTFSFSWEPNSNTDGVTGGTIVNGDLTYEVTRYPDGKVMDFGSDVRSVTDKWEFPDDNLRIVYYEVKSVYHGVKSTSARTRTMTFGKITPPYENGTSSVIDAAAFSWLSTPGDAINWQYIGAVTEQQRQHGWLYHGAANSQTPMDSYLVLSGMRLEKDKIYTLAFTAACTNTSWRNERMAVYLGDEVSETGLRKKTLIEPVLIYSRREEDGERHTCNFSVDKDGIYYLSFHHCSDPNLRYLYIGEVSISAPIDGQVPGEIRNVKAEAAAGGKLQVTLSFDMPDKSVGGQQLATPPLVRIERNGKKIAELPAAGGSRTYVDEAAENGVNNYVLVPFNDKGDGPKSTVNVFAGVGKPVNPSPRAWYGENDGSALIKWQPSLKDEFGTLLDSSNVRYDIQRVTIENGSNVRTVIAEGVKDTSYVDNYCSPTAEMQAVSYYVRAVTDGGTSQWVATRRVCLGKPEQAPWNESFADGKAAYYWFTAGQDVQWGPITDDVYDDAKSVDGDNGLMICVAAKANTATLLYSCPIVVPADMKNPEISFYYFNQDKYQGVPVKNNVALVIMDETGEHHVKSAVCNGPWGWQRMSYNMDSYRGKKVQIGVYAECVDRPSNLVDAFRLATRHENDIDMVTLRGPSEVEAGADAVFNVTFENHGSNPVAAGYPVELYIGDNKVAETPGPALEVDARGEVNFTVATNPTMGKEVSVHAKVRYDADNDPSNNVSNDYILSLVRNDLYPEPQNLSASRGDGKVSLEWAAPDMSRTPRKVHTETFDGFESFAKSIPGWTILDVDKGIVAPISSYIKVPESYGAPAGFFVQDSSVKPFNEFEEFKPFSGTKYMASQLVTDAEGNDMQCDDWLISPELSGHRQIASFMGKSISSSWLESFEVYYSTGSLEPSDFIMIGGVKGAPNAWIHYTAELPEGAKYFAIRCVSFARLQFMVDDVSLRLKSCDLVELNLLGYNVYRDGVKVNEMPVNATLFTDDKADSDAHRYMVTAVYKEGESTPSNEAGVGAGIIGIGSDGVMIYGVRGGVVIKGADGMDVTVSSLVGHTWFEGTVPADGRISLPAGVYAVTLNGRSAKVMVK